MFIIDNVKRYSVGTGSGTGSGGNFPEDDGYGIEGNRPRHMGPYTMDLTFQKIKDTTDGGFSTAKNTQSKKDFISKLSISYKESRETNYWLRILKDTGYITEKEFKSIIVDLDEVQKLLVSIIKTSKINS